MNIKKYIVGLALIILIAFAGFVYANPLFYPGWGPNNGSVASNASSSPVYMTPGTATTTTSYDAYLTDQVNGISKGTYPVALNTAILLVQLTATTGIPTLNIEIEDSRNGIDYYRRASSTSIMNSVDVMTMIFASSTATEGGAGVSATESIMQFSFNIQPRTRYMRAIGYLSSTTAVSVKNDDAAVYMELVPTKEQPK